LTAVEAALSKTVCITNGLAALENTVGNRGICVPGDASTKEWQTRALDALFSIMENKEKREQLIQANYAWASKMSWKNQAAKLMNEHINPPYPPLGKVSAKQEPNKGFQSQSLQSQSLQQPPTPILAPPLSKVDSTQSVEFRNNIQNTMNNLIMNNYSTYVPPAPAPKTSLAPKSDIPPITHPHYVPLNNGLETGGMLNWTHDLPSGQDAKATFEKVLKHFVDFNKSAEPRVLEVGVFAGTSLIEIMKRIPNSKGTAVDRWDNYEEINTNEVKNRSVFENPEIKKSLENLENIKERNIENIFYQNIYVSGLKDRVNTVKGDSHAVLLEMNRKNERYDFIYVDGSHKCLDVTTDLFLSWQLLESGGIMAIDDYLYTLEGNFTDNPFDYPFHAVNQFLERYKNEMIVLEKGYRVFVKKIHL
jgi:predicted O-methyltransferase YrrM